MRNPAPFPPHLFQASDCFLLTFAGERASSSARARWALGLFHLPALLVSARSGPHNVRTGIVRQLQPFRAPVISRWTTRRSINVATTSGVIPRWSARPLPPDRFRAPDEVSRQYR